jgi:hypothetical protein
MTKRDKFNILTQIFHKNPNNQIRFDFFAKQIIRKIREEWIESIFGIDEWSDPPKTKRSPDPFLDPLQEYRKYQWKEYGIEPSPDRPDYWQGAKNSNGTKDTK